LAIPVRARSHELRGLLAELLEAEVAITEEAHGVGLRVFGAGGIGSMAIVWSIRAISAAGGSFRGRIDAVGGRPLVLRRSSDAIPHTGGLVWERFDVAGNSPLRLDRSTRAIPHTGGPRSQRFALARNSSLIARPTR